MKKTLVTIAMVLAATSAQANDFQKVYKVDQTAANILTAAGDLKQTVTCSKWGVSMHFSGTVGIEAKDGKYRLTMSEMRSQDSGVLYQTLKETNSMAPNCDKAFEQYAKALNKKIAKWEDF